MPVAAPDAAAVAVGASHDRHRLRRQLYTSAYHRSSTCPPLFAFAVCYSCCPAPSVVSRKGGENRNVAMMETLSLRVYPLLRLFCKINCSATALTRSQLSDRTLFSQSLSLHRICSQINGQSLQYRTTPLDRCYNTRHRCPSTIDHVAFRPSACRTSPPPARRLRRLSHLQKCGWIFRLHMKQSCRINVGIRNV